MPKNQIISLLIFILAISSIKNEDIKEIPEDLHYLSKTEEKVKLAQGPSNSYLVMQFYNCDNRRIDFTIEVDGESHDYSFSEDVKFLYLPVKDGNRSPILFLKHDHEKLLRYSYSKESIFSFTPVLDKKMRISQNNNNFYVDFKNFARDVLNDYLVLFVRDFQESQINQLRNRCFLYKIMHGEVDQKFLLYQFNSKTSQNTISIKYLIDQAVTEKTKKFGIVALGKETTNFKTEIIYDPIFYEIKEHKEEKVQRRPDGTRIDPKKEVKKNSFTMKLIPYLLFALFVLFIYFARAIVKKNYQQKNNYSKMNDNEIYV